MSSRRARVFDHVGHVVHSIDESAEAWAKLGYGQRSEVYEDPRQGIAICFLSSSHEGAPRIELVQPVAEDSVVAKLLVRQGAGPYHMCFEVEELPEEVEGLQAQGYRALGEPAPSPAFGGRHFVFLYHRDTGLVELVQAAVQP